MVILSNGLISNNMNDEGRLSRLVTVLGECMINLCSARQAKEKLDEAEVELKKLWGVYLF